MARTKKIRSHTVYYAAGGLLFEWNSAKAAANQARHGVRFEEAAGVFLDRLHITALDTGHSTDETRYATIGTSEAGPLVVVFHTDRGDRIRIISARRPEPQERRDYEEGT